MNHISKALTIFFVSFFSIIQGQGQDLLSSRSSSYYTYIFKLTDKEAVKIYQTSLWVVDSSYYHTLVDSFPTDSVYKGILPPGNYLKTYADKGSQKLWITTVQNFNAYILNNETDLCIQVFDLQGNIIPDAEVMVGRKKLKYLKAEQYYVDRKSNKKGSVRVKYKGNTAFYDLNRQRNNPLIKRAYRKTTNSVPLRYVWKPVRFVVRLPVDGVKSIVRGYPQGVISSARYFFRRVGNKVAGWFDEETHYDAYSKNKNGYLVFNQPKYRQGDTVRYKAFIVDKKGRPLNKKLFVTLGSGPDEKKLGTLEPYRKGGFESEFVLNDSLNLKLDKLYTLYLKSENGTTYILNSFRYEDYELKSNQLDVRMPQDVHYRGRPFKIFIKGTDINEMNLLDGRIEVTLFPKAYLKYFDAYTFIPDTLMVIKQPLQPNGETEIAVPDSIFPNMNLEYVVHVKMLTADNEVRTYQQTIPFYYQHDELKTRLENDSVQIEFLRNGISEERNVKIYSYDNFNNQSLFYEGIVPVRLKLNSYYRNFLIEADTLNAHIQLDKEAPLLKSFSERDGQKVSILIDNPRKIPFSYNIYRRNKEIAAGRNDSLLFEQKSRSKQHYYIFLRYLWAGQIKEENYKIPLYQNQLHIQLEQPQIVSPGEKAEIGLQVTDMKGRPVKDVDVTAYSLTKKFGYSAPVLPYFGKNKKGKTFINKFHFEHRMSLSAVSQALNYEKWVTLAGIDSIAYYRFMFPQNTIYSYEYPMSDSITQFAPFVMSGGYPQAVHVIYVDNRPVYLSWSNHYSMYSFPVTPGYHQIKIRTAHKEFIIDSMYFSKGMKKIFSLDTALNSHSLKTETLSDTLTTFEQDVLHRYTIPVSYNSTRQNHYIQDNRQFFLLKNTNTTSREYVGPVAGNVTYGIFDDYSRSFFHEPFFEYSFAKELIKMKSNPASWFPKKLHRDNILLNLRDTVLSWQATYDNWKKSQEKVTLSTKKYINTRIPQYENQGNGRIRIQYETERKDLSYILLLDRPKKIKRAYPSETSWIEGLKENRSYQLLFLYENGDYHIEDKIYVQSGGSNRYNIRDPKSYLCDEDSLYLKEVQILFNRIEVTVNTPAYSYDYRLKERHWRTEPQRTPGSRRVEGTVFDETGEMLIGANILVKGTTFGVVTDFDGYFSLYVPEGSYTLVVSYLGYETQEVTIYNNSSINVYLKDESYLLETVVVSASRFESKMLEAPETIEVIRPESLQRLAGVTVHSDRMIPGISELITSANTGELLLIVNGKVFKGALQSLDQSLMIKVEVLKDKKDIEIYGPDAKNGVMLITMKDADAAAETDESPVRNMYIRSDFSDNAFWQPKLRTDKNGKARFEVVFPDDITNWTTHYLAMNDKKQTGQINGQIKSFKTLSGQLSVPRFLVEGDVADVIGKAFNYQSEPAPLATEFIVNGASHKTSQRICESVLIDTFTVKAGTDSLQVQYSITRNDGYFDGELRKIPVFPIGLEVTKGLFEVMGRDTTISITPAFGKGQLTIYARADALDVIKSEIVHVGNYKYYCNEQLASKLKALLAQKSISKYKKESFKGDEHIRNIILMLEERKKENGLWGWWKDSEVTYWISGHVLEALLLAKQMGYTVNFDRDKIATGLVYVLENDITPDKRLSLLKILKTIDAQIDYEKYLAPLDTLSGFSLAQQLKRIDLQQLVRGTADLEKLEQYKKSTLFGNIYYSETVSNPWNVHSNEIQNTINAYRVLKADTAVDHSATLSRMRNFFFEKRTNGNWLNIYISAQVIEAILPDLLKGGAAPEETKLEFKGDLNTTVTEFPASFKVNLSQPLEIKKSGDAPVYLSAHYHEWDKNPEVKKNDFEIYTSFTDTSQKVLEAGKKIILQTKVVVKKAAEYVMINIPVPGSCSYESKGRQHYFESHREYFRNEVAIFCEKLPAGTHYFDVELLPRYSGVYTINPAKIELMYFPVFNANNELKKISVK